MSDETPEPGVDEAPVTAPGTPDEAGSAESAAAVRRPSPGPSAASRARRIGGRPLPGPRPPAAGSGEPPSGKAAQAPKAATKTAPPPAPKPTRQPAPRTSDVAALQRRLDRLRWIPALIAAIAVLAAIGVGAWLSDGVWWGSKISSNRSEQQQQVLATAKACAVNLLSYDYRNLDDSQKKGDQCATGDYRTQYDQTFNSIVRKLAPQRKATQTLQIANGGVQSVSGDGKQWVILLFGQQSYSDNTQSSSTPRLDVATFAVTMTQIGRVWLVSAMNPTG